MVANERAARELGKGEPVDPAGLMKSLPPGCPQLWTPNPKPGNPGVAPLQARVFELSGILREEVGLVQILCLRHHSERGGCEKSAGKSVRHGGH